MRHEPGLMAKGALLGEVSVKKEDLELEGNSINGREKGRVMGDYKSAFPDPLIIRAGEKLRIGGKKSSWPGWIWCTNGKKHSGWVPERYVERQGETGLALYDYNATELSVSAGEELVLRKEESGWIWCTNQRGESGWVPAEHVEKLKEVEHLREYREPGCVFCNMLGERMVLENNLAYAIRDMYPVTALHTLIIPRGHVPNYFDLSIQQIEACHRLLVAAQAEIVAQDKDVRGFNIGINQGSAAGQTILHCHIHIIPRRIGDVDDPRGGIRHLMPGKGPYEMDVE